MSNLDANTNEAGTLSRGGRTLRLLWVPLACFFLGVSGFARQRQDRTIAEIAVAAEPCPFPLGELPLAFEGWRALEGEEQRLDPQVARIAGSTDHLIRTYVQEATGVAVTVLIIHGHGQTLSLHVPEVCYPTAGYGPGDDPIDIPIANPRAPSVFRSLTFSRPSAARTEGLEILYSFRHDGRWYPDAAADWKRFRDRPSMFKIQTQRKLAPHERRHVANPSEQFLSAFLPAVEARLARGNPTTPPVADAR